MRAARPVLPRPIASLTRAGGVALLVAALAGCDGGLLAPGGAPRSAPRPLPVPDTIAPPAPSAESEGMRAYYTQIAATLASQGLLRQDIAPRDAPFGARQLVNNFIRIALYDEYATQGGTIIARESPSRLRRWEAPVRMSVEYGASIPLDQRRKDSADISAFAGRLGRATGHPVSVVPQGGNFTVLVVNEDERRAIGPRLRALVPGIDPGSVRAVTDLSPATFCVVFAFSEAKSAGYSRAVAVIRGEHPDLLRLSCLHEELAQGMGLANDSPRARPSIFNDDEEFALLTRHDELLLRILYDPRLRPGMTEAEARPIIETITAELLGGES
ncbi:DUF2927 domain-containing protein [Phaeovulum sp. NW3]|uniref:DUF2927 domain-containing protein n=1 Tax=Phaeovulum sp. NW3 TaxID=2934933 RepID=UPI00202005B5|nr:DUF2927 domain-containing protein [Phaeovulum sp. NW3]MCL7465615.1 DUF2927 domain-containing protein [Phaeovulum sp. NW3]